MYIYMPAYMSISPGGIFIYGTLPPPWSRLLNTCIRGILGPWKVEVVDGILSSADVSLLKRTLLPGSSGHLAWESARA